MTPAVIAALLRTLAAELEYRGVEQTVLLQQVIAAEQHADSLAARLEEVKRIGQQYERDSRTFFDKSYKNLQRAERAEALLEAERKDAGRYRFIRQYAQNVTAGLVDWMSPDFAGGDMDTLDAAIDAAQKEPDRG